MSLITVEGDGSDKNDRLYGRAQYRYSCTAVWAMISMSGENGNVQNCMAHEGNGQPLWR